MWDWFVNLLTQILAGLQGFTGDWGLAVIILTFIIRILVSPLMTRSAVSNAKMQALAPKLQELQDKYGDDPQRYQEEVIKFQSENNFNPFGGCLPIFLQMPVFFALFTVARNVPADASLFNILPSISKSVSEMVAQNGVLGSWVYILFDVLFGILTLVPLLLNSANQPEESRRQTLTMGVVMAIMMMWFGWSVPAAVLLYYNTSSIWQVIQQRFITQRVLNQEKEKEAERQENEPATVDVVRREKKKRPRKKK